MLTITRIKPQETEIYKTLRIQSLKDSPGAFGSKYESALARSPESWNEQVIDAAQGTDQIILLARIDDKPVGLAGLYRLDTHPHVGELVQVWVMPSRRRDGVAGKLMDAIFEWAGRNNYKSVTAGIMAGNAPAMTFYQNYGFTPETGIVLNCPGDAAVLIKDIE